MHIEKIMLDVNRWFLTERLVMASVLVLAMQASRRPMAKNLSMSCKPAHANVWTVRKGKEHYCLQTSILCLILLGISKKSKRYMSFFKIFSLVSISSTRILRTMTGQLIVGENFSKNGFDQGQQTERNLVRAARCWVWANEIRNRWYWPYCGSE